MQIPILSGIVSDASADWRTQYPRNLIPVPKKTGIADGYLRPSDGIVPFATGPGTDRGGFNWNGVMYRVMGTKLCSVSAAGAVTELGDVGAGGQVTMDNGFDRLAIWSGGRLYYWDGSTLAQVTDPDLGNVIDGRWIAGYYLSTDGEFLIVTELNDPFAVDPLKYGSVESDPDRILAVDELRNEAYALGRFTIEVFENVGGTGFPFQRIEGAQVVRGIIGTHAYAQFAQTFAFLGSARNEAPAVYIMGAGGTDKLSTREIDEVLLRYTEEQLSAVVVEAKVDKGHNWLMMHLPDTCWVYDLAASQVVGEPIWFELNSAVVGLATYRARNLVWCYDAWISGDPTTQALGRMVDNVSTHYGQTIGWDFGTMVLYNESRGAVVHELELVALPGRVALGADPVIWTSFSLDGETWSQERATPAGRQGQRLQRIAWRRQGKMRQYRMQRFRGTSDAHISIARLEAEIEALNG
jgi:hypothetical protein